MSAEEIKREIDEEFPQVVNNPLKKERIQKRRKEREHMMETHQ